MSIPKGYLRKSSACARNDLLIRECISDGVSASQIAKRIGTGPRHVLRYLKGKHIPYSQPTPACELHDSDICQWASENLALSEIARRIGTKNQIVRAYLTKHNIAYNRQHNVGSCNPAWAGGRILDKQGYVLLHHPEHPFANAAGYVREHRLVMEQQLGRYLSPIEVVHHKDDSREGRQNNAPENLRLYSSNADHLRETRRGRIPNWSDPKKVQEACRKGRERIAANRLLRRSAVSATHCALETDDLRSSE